MVWVVLVKVLVSYFKWDYLTDQENSILKYKLSILALCFIAFMSFFVKAQGNMQEAEKALDAVMSDVVNFD